MDAAGSHGLGLLGLYFPAVSPQPCAQELCSLFMENLCCDLWLAGAVFRHLPREQVHKSSLFFMYWGVVFQSLQQVSFSHLHMSLINLVSFPSSRSRTVESTERLIASFRMSGLHFWVSRISVPGTQRPGISAELAEAAVKGRNGCCCSFSFSFHLHGLS